MVMLKKEKIVALTHIFAQVHTLYQGTEVLLKYYYRKSSLKLSLEHNPDFLQELWNYQKYQFLSDASKSTRLYIFSTVLLQHLLLNTLDTICEHST
jgi:hypothetical protein